MSSVAEKLDPVAETIADVVDIKPEATEPENRVVKAAGPKVQKLMNGLDVVGLGFINPFIRLAHGEDPKAQFKQLWKILLLSLIHI